MKSVKLLFLLIVALVITVGCSNENDSISNSENLSKSINEDSEITATQYIENEYGLVPTLIESTEIIEVERGNMGLIKYQIGENTDLEVYATSNLSTGNIIHAIEINWATNEWNMTDVYWNEVETGLLDADGVEINQGDDLIDIAEINSAAEQQNYEPKFRVRGFGWTCGPIVESPGGNYRTCCHRLFWRRTKPCDQYGTGNLPGSNPRIISINR